MAEKTYVVRLSFRELWELINAADQASSEPCEAISSGKEVLWAAYHKAIKEPRDDA